MQVEPKVQKLYDYIKERGTILPIHDYSQELLSKDDVHKRVAESIRSGKPLMIACHPASAWPDTVLLLSSSQCGGLRSSISRALHFWCKSWASQANCWPSLGERLTQHCHV